MVSLIEERYKNAPFIEPRTYAELDLQGYEIHHHAFLSKFWFNWKEENLPEQYCFRSLRDECYGVLPFCQGDCFHGCAQCANSSKIIKGKHYFILN